MCLVQFGSWKRELRSGSLDLSGPLFQWWHQETFAWKTMIVMITVEASRLSNKFTAFNTHEFIKSLKKICFEAKQLEERMTCLCFLYKFLFLFCSLIILIFKGFIQIEMR